jgi:cytochrome c oxidase subunit 4
MVGLLNLGSLVLGLIAWILPVVNLMRYGKRDHRDWIVLAIMSISACAISLCSQILYQYHLVRIGDWSALMDTTAAAAFVSTTLLAVTIALNAMTLIVYRDRTAGSTT